MGLALRSLMKDFFPPIILNLFEYFFFFFSSRQVFALPPFLHSAFREIWRGKVGTGRNRTEEKEGKYSSATVHSDTNALIIDSHWTSNRQDMGLQKVSHFTYSGSDAQINTLPLQFFLYKQSFPGFPPL